MKFKVGDRVKFTNRGSWYNDFNGTVGTVINDKVQDSILVKFDKTTITDDFINDFNNDTGLIVIGDCDYYDLRVCSVELELVEEDSDNESNNN